MIAKPAAAASDRGVAAGRPQNRERRADVAADGDGK